MNSSRNHLRSLISGEFHKSVDALIDFKFSLTSGAEFKSQLLNDPELKLGFLRSLQRENLDFLFYSSIGDDSSAGALFNDLKSSFQLEMGYQLIKKYESSRVIKSLGQQVIFFKGFVLAHLLKLGLYKRNADVDILVRKLDVTKVIGKLELLGYKRLPCFSNGELSMRNQTGTVIDLHYDLTASSPFIFISRLNIDEMFDRIEYYDIPGGMSTPTFDSTFTLINLLVHFSINHQLKQFVLCYEIGRFIKLYNDRIDWDFIAGYSKKHNLETALYLALKVIILFHPDLNKGIGLNAILTSRQRRQKLDIFLADRSVVENLLLGSDNNLKTNDIPRLSATTFFKWLNFERGNLAWNNREYH